ncbi:MAG: thiamine pyrophosphate-binding protein, partial [Candidatus Thorarchaeota archaeon]
LANAESPVILAGGGVLRAGATSELVTLAETLAIPVVTTLSGKGAFPEDHPLFGYYPGTKGSPIGNDLTTTSDVILALGCRFADETTSSYEQGISFNIPPTKLIQVDIDSGELGKNYTPEISILADARAFLNQVLVRVGDLGLSRDYRGSDIVTKLQIARDEWMADLLKQREGTPMTISRLLHEIRTAIPRDAFLVTSAGHTQAAAFQEFPILEPNTHISSGGFSTMGFGLPAALGVKLAHPERKVISLEGDGSFLMTCQELATAVQYDIPIVVVIADNQGWISIRDLQIDAYGNDRIYATEFLRKSDNSPYSPDFVKLAKSFGCKSNQANSPSELQTSMSQALNDNQPWVIVTTVERTHPRSESPVYGYWDVPKPDYLE